MASFYQRRDQRARQEGWRSYAHYRKASEIAEAELGAYDPRVRDRFMQVAKGFSTPRIGVQQMRVWIRGAKALVAGDHELADRIGESLPDRIRLDPERPESMFWYH